MNRTQHYFDHNATSPPDDRVVQAMLPWLGPRHGNPSSLHGLGRAARGAIELARRRVAEMLSVQPQEIVFVGSGSEANNAVFAGLLDERLRASRTSATTVPRAVVCSFEHPSVIAAAARAERWGAEVVRVPPQPDGCVCPRRLAEAIGDDGRTVLVSVMLANNEIGTVQPVAEVAEVAHRAGALLLCDAVQAAGKMRVNPEELNADFLVIAGHKFHGPMGVGVLWIRSGVEIEPFLVGGGQERRRRAGTENVAAIVGLGEACDLAHRELVERADHLRTLRDRFEEQVLAQVPGSFVHCAQSPRLPNTCSLRLEGLRAQELLIRLDLAGFAVSTGSACASGAVEPSPTLLALGMNATQALGTLRISFGMPNSVAEVDALAEALRREVSRLREVAAAQTSHAPRATPTRQQGVAQPSRTAKAKPSSRVAP